MKRTRISDILSAKGSNIHTIGKHEFVTRAAERMTESDVGSLVVTYGDAIAGIVTERDCLRHLADRERSSASTRVLEIMTADADEVAKKITCAGATFIGQWTPEPVGDFTAGPSHVLPTGGAARFFSGLTVDQFVRRISQVKYDQEALKREAAALAAFGGTEELDAHARSVSIRLDQ